MTQQARHQRSEIKSLTTYWDRTQWPLQSLLFLTPLVVLYEVGTVLYVRGSSATMLQRIKAESLLDRFFELFGITGVHLPALLVVVVLLLWHVVRRDPWQFEGKLYLFMAVESLILAVPLLVFGAVLVRTGMLSDGQPMAMTTVVTESWQSALLLSIGAGIYEELLFRLIGIALLHMLLVDLLALPEHWGAILAVLGSALAFALYHFSSFGDIRLGPLAFYVMAGVYLAVVYVVRGFGIVVGTHAIYDVMALCLPMALRGAGGE